MKIKLNCIACGHLIEFGEAYEDYEGEIKCWVCTAMLEVKIHEGGLKAMKLVRQTESVPDKALERGLA